MGHLRGGRSGPVLTWPLRSRPGRPGRPRPAIAVMLARVFPLCRSGAGAETEIVIATLQARRGTLVVVDDHARYRAAVAERLAAAGWRIVGEAATGATAIELVARLRPDVVLLDVVLPDMDGFAVADRLAAAGSASVVVLTSGHERGDFAGRVRAAPVRGFLPQEMISGPAPATLPAGGPPGSGPGR